MSGMQYPSTAQKGDHHHKIQSILVRGCRRSVSFVVSPGRNRPQLL
jgi:hypothetical protein